MKRLTITPVWLLLACIVASGQSQFQGLQPGRSTKEDAERVLGQPMSQVSETLIEYKAQQQGQKIYIQYRKDSPTIVRIEVLFNKPVDRSAVAGLLGLPQQADTTKWDSKGRLEEYFGSTKMIVLTHDAGEVASPVSRVGYYSRELFEVALSKPQGQPQTKPSTQNRPAGSGSIPSQSAARTNAREIVIPEGTKITAVTTEKISSRTAKVGDPLILKVTEPVGADGRVMIDKGTTITGSITTVEKSGRMGKSGKLAVRVESATAVDGQEIKLRPSKNRGGPTEFYTVSVSSLFTPLGVLMLGEEAVIKKGLKFKVYTDEEKRILVKD